MGTNTIRIEWKSFGELLGDHEAFHKSGTVISRGDGAPRPLSPCEVVLVHPRSHHTLTLEAVVVGPCHDGTRLALRNFDSEMASQLYAFLMDALAPTPAERIPAPEDTVDEPPSAAEDDISAEEDASGNQPEHVRDKIRALSPPERRRLAATGTMAERKALERAYGKDVWEALLSNPRITAPEVARVARMGSLPAPLIDRITGQLAWLSSPQVRRALLSNPRLRGQALQKVLAAAPRSELKLMTQQTSYPQHVREAARKLVNH